MIAKSITLLLVLGAALGRNLDNVDPNTLSCDSLGLEHLLLPHFTDCNKFYTCAHGNEVEFSCPGSTIFDFPLQTCNHAWATQCWLRSNATTESEEIEGSGDENEEQVVEELEEGSGSGEVDWLDESSTVFAKLTGKNIAVAVKEPVIRQSHFNAILDCSNVREAARMVPFKGDCQRYWRCSDGLLLSTYCSDGLFFNERTQQCDFESNVRCAIDHDEELQGEYMLYQ